MRVEAAVAAAAVAAAVLEVADPAVADLEVAVLRAEAPSVDRKHSEVDWSRATLHHRNPWPKSAPRARTLRQDLLPGGCSPHINACPRRRFRIPTGCEHRMRLPVRYPGRIMEEAWSSVIGLPRSLRCELRARLRAFDGQSRRDLRAAFAGVRPADHTVTSECRVRGVR